MGRMKSSEDMGSHHSEPNLSHEEREAIEEAIRDFGQDPGFQELMKNLLGYCGASGNSVPVKVGMNFATQAILVEVAGTPIEARLELFMGNAALGALFPGSNTE